MKFIVNDVLFVPHKWNMDANGKWGDIYFLIQKDVLSYGSNSGAFCSKFNDKFDLAHMETPYMKNGDRLEDKILSELLKEAASTILDALPLKTKEPVS